MIDFYIDEGPPGYNGVMSEDGGSPRPDPNTMDADMPSGKTLVGLVGFKFEKLHD